MNAGGHPGGPPFQGPPGPQGPQGPQGPYGQSGQSGQQGSYGQSGQSGQSGQQGPYGSPGPYGPGGQNPQGPQGPYAQPPYPGHGHPRQAGPGGPYGGAPYGSPGPPGPPGSPPYPAPYPPQGPPPRRKRTGLLVSLVVVLLAAAGVAGFLVLRGEDEDGTPSAGPTSSDAGPADPSDGGGGTSASGSGKGTEVEQPLVIPAALPTDAGPKFNATADGATWPKACDMLTDAQIQKVVKGAVVEEREADTVRPRGDHPGVTGNECRIKLKIPDPGDPTYPTYGTISLTLREIGNPAAAKGYYNETKRDRGRKPFGVFEDLGTRLHTDDAFRDGSYFQFVKNGYFVETYFSSGLRTPGGERAPEDMWAKRVGPTFVGYLAARM